MPSQLHLPTLSNCLCVIFYCLLFYSISEMKMLPPLKSVPSVSWLHPPICAMPLSIVILFQTLINWTLTGFCYPATTLHSLFSSSLIFLQKTKPLLVLSPCTSLGSISRCRPINELYHGIDLHSSQANPNPTRANSRILLKQFSKSLTLIALNLNLER